MSVSGLKEFGDGDAALFDGGLADIYSDEDFEFEIRNVLSAEDTQNTNNYNNKTSFNSNRTVPTLNTNTSSTSANLDYYMFPSELIQLDNNSCFKFEEDPLSAYMNQQQIQNISQGKKKRGRPPLIKFKTFSPNHMKTSDDFTFINSHSKTRTLTLLSEPVQTIIPNSSTNFSPNYIFQKPKISTRSLPTTSSQVQVQIRERRFDNDVYSPKYVRGRGIDREGCCPLCSPTVWFKIKQSAYWYHMNFYHGISAATGRPYNNPINYRYGFDEKDKDKETHKFVEGRCGRCFNWIVLATSESEDQPLFNKPVESQISMNSWFRHAQKCHHRPKDLEIPSPDSFI